MGSRRSPMGCSSSSRLCVCDERHRQRCSCELCCGGVGGDGFGRRTSSGGQGPPVYRALCSGCGGRDPDEEGDDVCACCAWESSSSRVVDGGGCGGGGAGHHHSGDDDLVASLSHIAANGILGGMKLSELGAKILARAEAGMRERDGSVGDVE
eukprot:832495-Rhodomonas_salina.1